MRDVFSFFELRPAVCTDLDRVHVLTCASAGSSVDLPACTREKQPPADEDDEDEDEDDVYEQVTVYSSTREQDKCVVKGGSSNQQLSAPTLEFQQSFSAPDLKHLSVAQEDAHKVSSGASCDQLSSCDPEAAMAAAFKLYEFDEVRPEPLLSTQSHTIHSLLISVSAVRLPVSSDLI